MMMRITTEQFLIGGICLAVAWRVENPNIRPTCSGRYPLTIRP
jgi:hypothetical protein